MNLSRSLTQFLRAHDQERMAVPQAAKEQGHVGCVVIADEGRYKDVYRSRTKNQEAKKISKTCLKYGD